MVYWEITCKDGTYELKVYRKMFSKLLHKRTETSRQDPKTPDIHPIDKLLDIINEYGKTKQIPSNKTLNETA